MNTNIEQIIKNDFCNLIIIKNNLSNNILEINIPLVTLDDKFISVFLNIKDNDYIISDNGWINLEYYEIKNSNNQILNKLKEKYNIKEEINKFDEITYFKQCKSEHEISSLIFDIAHFILNVINYNFLNC